MEQLTLFSAFTEQYFWHAAIVFLRVGAVVALLPAFGEQAVPTRIKLVIAVAFTAIVAPAVPVNVDDFKEARFFALVGTETLSGFLIGIGVRLFLMALQTAGAIAAQSTSLSQLLGGAIREPLAAIGYILTMGAMALAVITGLHVKAAAAMIGSYDVLPIGYLASGADIADWGVNRVSKAFQLAFVLSAPFILVSVLYNLALGAINKAMPQLMVSFVGAPLITFGGLFILFVASPLILSTWVQALDVFLASPFEGTQ